MISLISPISGGTTVLPTFGFGLTFSPPLDQGGNDLPRVRNLNPIPSPWVRPVFSFNNRAGKIDEIWY